MTEGPSDAPINLGGVGDIDMYPHTTYMAAYKIYLEADRYGDTWQNQHQAIDAAERQLSHPGRLNARFREQYNPVAEGLFEAIDAVAPQFRLLGYLGTKAVGDYLETARRAAELLSYPRIV